MKSSHARYAKFAIAYGRLRVDDGQLGSNAAAHSVGFT